MIDLSQRRGLGDSIAEYIETIPYELNGDGVGFWVIVPAGRSFRLGAADLAEFVRLCIVRLVEAGGVPVRHADVGDLEWQAVEVYGSTSQKIADAVVAEWLASGGQDPDWESLWFVTPELLKTDRRWQAEAAG